jgi:hypothetical protein
VTEGEWDICTNPDAMLRFLHSAGNLPDRKGRLFSVACCHRVWQYLEEPSRRAVGVIERLADGHATEPERSAAEAEASAVSACLAAATFGARHAPIPPEACAAAAVLCLTASTADEATWLPFGQFIAEQVAMHVLLAEWQALGEPEFERAYRCGEDRPRLALSELVRDVFAYPFRHVIIAKPWQTPEVVSLAQSIYNEMEFGKIGLLAEALEKAGCGNADILGHCRGPRTHVRGCWVLDLVLGKE